MNTRANPVIEASHRDTRCAAAFTLMELLLAVAVFSIALAAISTVFFSAFRLRTKTVEAVERGLPVHQAVSIIKRDLEGIVIPGTNQILGPLTTSPLSGNSATSTAMETAGDVQFFTTTGSIDNQSPWAEVQRVSYVLQFPTNTTTPGRDLFRVVTRNMLPVNLAEDETQFLLSGVENIYYEFYDGVAWSSEWDSDSATTKLPAGLKITLEMARETGEVATRAPIEIVVPVLLRASTNTTQSTGGGQ
jgi:type II secretion system protein J